MISLECPYCATVLITAAPAPEQTESAFRSAWKSLAATQPYHACPGCIGEFQIDDDGDPDGLVELGNITRPSLNSINVVTGAREGGNALIITGNALDAGTLVVRFAEEPAVTVDNRTATTARIVVPRATYAINVLEQCHKLTLNVAPGALAVDEAVTSDAGSTGVIRLIEGSTYWIAFANFAETLNEMIGTNLTGGVSGGVASVVIASAVEFLVDEVITGQTSGAFAVVRDAEPLVVTSPTAGFAPNELVRGDFSDALVKLTSSPAYSGLVDVTVENEYGQRPTGASLLGAYTYA